MSGTRFAGEDLPDLPYARQLKAGFPWLTFDAALEPVYRQTVLDEQLPHIRVNLCLGIIIAIAISAMQATVLGRELNRVPGILHMLVMLPVLLLCLAASFSANRHRIYPRVTLLAAVVVGLSVVAVQLIAAHGGVTLLYPGLELATIFIYFMAGLIFY